MNDFYLRAVYGRERPSGRVGIGHHHHRSFAFLVPCANTIHFEFFRTRTPYPVCINIIVVVAAKVYYAARSVRGCWQRVHLAICRLFQGGGVIPQAAWSSSSKLLLSHGRTRILSTESPRHLAGFEGCNALRLPGSATDYLSGCSSGFMSWFCLPARMRRLRHAISKPTELLPRMGRRLFRIEARIFHQYSAIFRKCLISYARWHDRRWSSSRSPARCGIPVYPGQEAPGWFPPLFASFSVC